MTSSTRSGCSETHHLEEVAADQGAEGAFGRGVNSEAVGLIVLRHDVDEGRTIAEVLV